jgi:hypothetical protein
MCTDTDSTDENKHAQMSTNTHNYEEGKKQKKRVKKNISTQEALQWQQNQRSAFCAFFPLNSFVGIKLPNIR